MRPFMTQRSSSKRQLLLAAGTFVVGLAGFVQVGRGILAEARGGAHQRVLVATRDLDSGEVLERGALAGVSIPERYLDGRRIEATQAEELWGARLTTSVQAGQGVLWSDVATAGGPKKLAHRLAPGRRAYHLPGTANPFGILLHAGDRVDVLLQTAGEAETVLQNVSVLAVGVRLEPPSEQEDSAFVPQSSGINLDVSPAQAEALLAAAGRGRLRVVIRHPEDQALAEPEIEASRNEGRSGGRRKEIERVR